jgi:hypothetical protein
MNADVRVKDLQRRYNYMLFRIEALQIESEKLLIQIRLAKADREGLSEQN